MAATDPDTNTHPMPYGFNTRSSTVFSIVAEPEWDESHYTFEAPDGMRYRVPKEAVRYVCPRPDDVPSQPPIGYAILFEDETEWVRYNDGYWHAWTADRIENYDAEANAQTWEDLWAAHGTTHYRLLCPVRPDQIPWVMDREGPIGQLVMPSLDDDGEPTPGNVAWLQPDSPDIHIRNVASNAEIVIPGGHFMTMAEMFLRTLWKRSAADNATITVPDDVSALDEPTKE